MVLAASSVRLLEKAPVPVPSVVLLLAMVGFWEVDQHTPLAVTVAPPSLVTLPPEEAVVEEEALVAAVVTVGGEAGQAGVVKLV